MTTPSHPAPHLDHVCDLRVRVGRRTGLGDGVLGERRLVEIVGGDVDGPLLAGRVIAGGADWQTIRRDGAVEIDAHYVIETHDGALIEVHDRGVRRAPSGAGEHSAQPDGAPTMMGAIRLTTGDERYAWVDETLFVGAGSKSAEGVTISVYRVG